MSYLKWKLLSSEYLFKQLWFSVRKDICETPDGKIVDPYFVYEFPEWVTAACLTEDNKMLLVKQYRHALGEECIETPGGCVDNTDKSYQEAIAREILEETGYVFTTYDHLGKISANPSTNNNLMHMFLARGGKKVQDQKLDHNEEIEILLYKIEEVKKLLKENRIMQSMHAVCLFYALNRLGEMSY